MTLSRGRAVHSGVDGALRLQECTQSHGESMTERKDWGFLCEIETSGERALDGKGQQQSWSSGGGLNEIMHLNYLMPEAW